MIADRIHRVARSRFWRWPTIRLNQVNWYALDVRGRRDRDRQPGAAARATCARSSRASSPAARARQLRARPALPVPAALRPARARERRLGRVREHRRCRSCASTTRGGARGWRRCRAPAAGCVRRWIRRAIAGYWTHAGYMNWDSGLGFERWHQAKKLGLAQQALIGIAQTPRLQPGREWGRWAKWMLDRGLRFYERLPRARGRPARPGAVPALHGAADGRQRAARGRAARRPTRRARSRPGSGGCAASGRRRCTRTTPTSAGSRSRRRAYNTAIVAGQPARVPVRRDRARAAVRRRAGRRRRDRRPRAGGVRAAGARAERAARVLLPDRARRVDPHVTPLRLTRAPVGDRRERADAAGQGVRRAVPRPAGARHADGRALPRGHLAPLPRDFDRDALAAHAAARAARV